MIFLYLISRIWNLVQLCVVVFLFCFSLGGGVVEPVFMGSLL